MRKLLYKNSLFGLLQNILSAILLFVTIPLFIKMLGNDAYGMFVLVSIIGNLNVFTNIGLNTSLLKYISEQGKCEESDNDISISIILILAIVIPISALALYFNKLVLINILNTPANYLNDTYYLYVYLIFANTLLMIGQIASTVLDSQQKIYITNTLQILYNFLYWGLLLIFLLLKMGLKEIGIAIFIAALIWFILVNYYAYKHWGSIKLKGTLKNFKRVAKKQTSLGFQVYIAGLIGFFNEPITKVFISQFIGIGFVSFFDIALKFRNQLWGLFGKAFHPLTPYISQLKESEKVKILINDLQQKLFYFSIPVVIIFIFCINAFISLWIGSNVKIISITCAFIVSGYLLFSIPVLPIYVYLMVKGKPFKTIIIQLTNVIVNSAVFFTLLKFAGYYSIIAANFAAVLFSFILCLYYQKIYLNSNIFESFHKNIKLVSLFLILFICSLILHYVIKDNLLTLIIIPVSILSVCVLLFRFLKFFSNEDIIRYFGEGNFVSDFTLKILLKQKV